MCVAQGPGPAPPRTLSCRGRSTEDTRPPGRTLGTWPASRASGRGGPGSGMAAVDGGELRGSTQAGGAELPPLSHPLARGGTCEPMVCPWWLDVTSSGARHLLAPIGPPCPAPTPSLRPASRRGGLSPAWAGRGVGAGPGVGAGLEGRGPRRAGAAPGPTPSRGYAPLLADTHQVLSGAPSREVQVKRAPREQLLRPHLPRRRGGRRRVGGRAPAGTTSSHPRAALHMRFQHRESGPPARSSSGTPGLEQGLRVTCGSRHLGKPRPQGEHRGQRTAPGSHCHLPAAPPNCRCSSRAVSSADLGREPPHQSKGGVHPGDRLKGREGHRDWDAGPQGRPPGRRAVPCWENPGRHGARAVGLPGLRAPRGPSELSAPARPSGRRPRPLATGQASPEQRWPAQLALEGWVATPGGLGAHAHTSTQTHTRAHRRTRARRALTSICRMASSRSRVASQSSSVTSGHGACSWPCHAPPSP